MFQPPRYYITFDFETLEDPVNEQISEHTTLDANLVPFMVSSTVKSASGRETVNFCLANEGENFVEQWIEFLFAAAQIVANDNINQYGRFHINDDIKPGLVKELQEEFCYSLSNLNGYN